MDIALLSIALSQSQVQQAASVAVLKKAMDTGEAGADAVLKLMEQSVQPQLGTNIDMEG